MRLINADEFRELIDGGYDLNFDDVPNTKKELLRMIDNAPTVDAVERKRGEWVKNEDRYGWHCSCCKVDNNYAYSWNSESGRNEFQDNFCPNCGAEMRGEANDDAMRVCV